MSVHADLCMHDDQMKRLQRPALNVLRPPFSLHGRDSNCSDWLRAGGVPSHLGFGVELGMQSSKRGFGSMLTPFVLTYTIQIFQAVKNVLSMSEKEISKQNNVEKFEIREQNRNKTEAKWKYKVRSFQQRWCSSRCESADASHTDAPAR